MNFREFKKTQDIVFEMLADRRYIIDQEKLTEDEFGDEDITMIFEKKNGVKVMVVWLINKGLGISVIKTYASTMKEEGIPNAIMIYGGKYTSAAQTSVKNLSRNECKIEVFSISDVSFNPTKHRLVPKYSLVPKTKSSELIEKYGAKIQFPKIKMTDPIIRYYGWGRGNIVKVERPNGELTFSCIV